jgi:hypothetical protein
LTGRAGPGIQLANTEFSGEAMRLFRAVSIAGVCVILAAGLLRADEVVLLPPATADMSTGSEAKLSGPPIELTEAEKSVSDGAVEKDPRDAAATEAAPEKKDDNACVVPWVPEFIGDQAPIGSIINLPAGRIHGPGALYAPSARYFKISDDESPRPQTREYFSFNYFYDLGDSVNRLSGGIQHTRIHREIFGLEWASDDGSFSVGLRLPIDTYNATGSVAGLDGASTDIGDLSVIFKWLLWEDKATGSLVSTGLAVTPPTGPSPFAGSRDLAVFHNTCLQPYCGWIWPYQRFYVQGFTAVDAPTDLNDVVMLSNSIAAGYFVYQNQRGDGLTAVVPVVELHVNNPLNHRGILRLSDPAGTPDTVDITGGIQFEYKDKSSLAIAFATPVTGPRMFDFEILAQFRWRY